MKSIIKRHAAVSRPLSSLPRMARVSGSADAAVIVEVTDVDGVTHVAEGRFRG